MINFKQYINESYMSKLRTLNVSDDIIKFIESIPDRNDRGYYVSMIISNPSLTLHDIKKRVSPRDENILVLDPTPDGSYYDIISKWMKNKSIRGLEDTSRVHEVLKYYNKHKSKFKTKYASRYRRFHDMESEYLQISGNTDNMSKRELIRLSKKDGAELVYENIHFMVYMISKKEAACIYAKGTRWCTSNSKTAQDYLKDGPLYVFIDKKTKEKYQADHIFSQIVDEADNDISGVNEDGYETYADTPDEKTQRQILNICFKFAKNRLAKQNLSFRLEMMDDS